MPGGILKINGVIPTSREYDVYGDEIELVQEESRLI